MLLLGKSRVIFANCETAERQHTAAAELQKLSIAEAPSPTQPNSKPAKPNPFDFRARTQPPGVEDHQDLISNTEALQIW